MASGGLVLRNAFRDPASLAVQFEREPEEMTLEAVLYRVLGGDLLFSSVGGRPMGHGLARFYTANGAEWQELVRLLVERAQLIFIIPHLSEGVRWEIGQLIELDAAVASHRQPHLPLPPLSHQPGPARIGTM